MKHAIQYLDLTGADPDRLERLGRFIERYEPYVADDCRMLQQVLRGHPQVCPMVSLAGRIGLARS